MSVKARSNLRLLNFFHNLVEEESIKQYRFRNFEPIKSILQLQMFAGRVSMQPRSTLINFDGLNNENKHILLNGLNRPVSKIFIT